jgi:hypothetical protein
MFGGSTYGAFFNETWEWDGELWTGGSAQAPPAAPSPAPTLGTAITFDSARHRTVAVSQSSASPPQMETWEWDGASWSRRSTSGPSPRIIYGLVYDDARNRTVLFGGAPTGGTVTTQLGDTWEWDGANWAQVATEGPSPRTVGAMIYDGRRVILFGGNDASGALTDSWTWDGVSWTLLAGTGFPGGQVAYDAARGRAVLFHGTASASTTWEWDGAVWAQRSASGPSPRVNVGMSYDAARSRVVLFGGSVSNYLEGGVFGDTWEWDGNSWTQRGPTEPSPRLAHALAYDTARERTVMFGGQNTLFQGLGDTWLWNGARWTQSQATGPPARLDHAMAYDRGRDRVVLFGGRATSYAGATRFSDTWEWDGSAWTQIPGAGPSARFRHAMAYDRMRGRVILFGGTDGTTSFGDTWAWDGSAWTQLSVSGPSPRSGHAMTYDPAHQVVLLFGGAFWSDTWAWDGAEWSPQRPMGWTVIPGGGLEFDPIRQCTFLYGGGGGYQDRFMEWDGHAWSTRLVYSSLVRENSPVVYDESRHCMVLFGGYGTEPGDLYTSRARCDTWELPSTPAPPAVDDGPRDAIGRVGGTISFTVAATGDGPLAYQWYSAAFGAIHDGPGGATPGGGTVSGSTTATLTISNVQLSDIGLISHTSTYGCTVTNTCGSIHSEGAQLFVQLPCGSADFNHDGAPGTDLDIEAFFACIAGNCCPSCDSPDFDGDGAVSTDADIEAFFRVLAGGAC